MENGNDFKRYQIAASEALRAGGQPDLSIEAKTALFQEAAEHAAKAFLAAKDNMYYRYLAICQHTCAQGLVLLTTTGFNSVVVSAQEPEEFHLEDLATGSVRP